MKICFLARSLGHGGAERQLCELAAGLHRRGWAVTVVLFYGGGELEADLHASGVEVKILGKRGRWDVVPFGLRLLRVLRGLGPDLVHAYLSVPNLIAALVKPLLPGARVVWGLRASDMDLGRYDWLARLVGRLEPALARAADLVIVNSTAGQRHAAAKGFPAERLRMVPNGIDTQRFRADSGSGLGMRAEWGMTPGMRLIGLVARLDPMKDHHTFLAAVSIFLASGAAARFICIGDGPVDSRRALQADAERRGVASSMVWAGPQSDMPGVYNALDLVTLTSAFGEGFPNALGEAMACGVPCVATDAGDAVEIIGDTGIVVPRRDPVALAAAWRQMLDRLDWEGAAPGARARERIVARFGVEAMIERSEALLQGLLVSRPSR